MFKSKLLALILFWWAVVHPHKFSRRSRSRIPICARYNSNTSMI